jgi:hypothetical protein
MAHEIIYDRATGQVLLARRIAAPRDDLQPGEGQGKLFIDFDPGDRLIAAFRIDPDKRRLEPRDDFSSPESDVRLALSCDAAAMSPVEDIPALPADGQTQTTVTVEKRALADDRPLVGAAHKNKVKIRTTAGTLSDNIVTLRKGKATFTLRSSTETVVAEVKVWADDIALQASLRIEFTPVGQG